MIKSLNNKLLFFALIVAYILGDAYVLVYKKGYFYLYNLIPLAILTGYWAIYSINTLVYLIVFSTPLAISLSELGIKSSFGLSLPSEPLMAIVMVIYIINELSFKVSPKAILKHPLTIIILIQLSWMLFTSFTSQDIGVSIKAFIARLWFVISGYFIFTLLMKDKKHIYNLIYAYSFSMAIVCIITLAKHASFRFDHKIADWIVSPFYNDHTAYGAALAMFIPVHVTLLFCKDLKLWQRSSSIILLSVFIVAIILSFARAGWLSLVVVTGVYVLLRFRIKFWTIIATLVTGLSIFFIFQDQILIALNRNDTDSEGDFSKNISSMSNISTDASNLERLNRWSCAYRMFQDRPVLGFGPGTYQFFYAPYQKSNERTIISTNFGDGGNSHSEYLGPLCEQGVLGLVFVLALIVYVGYLGFKMYYETQDPNVRLLILGLFLGMLTYFVHGFLNNFLDTDKLSLPYWSFLAALISLDVYHRKNKQVTVAP